MIKVNQKKIEDVAYHWGHRMPMMTMEECGELIQAISKLERKGTQKCRDNLKEEIRDVYISLMALQSWYDITDHEMEEMIDEKLNMKKDK